MPEESDPMRELAAVLREVGASPRVRTNRIARSTLYDLDYHIALIACAFVITAGDKAARSHRVIAHWLKVLQFVAVRPTILPDFKVWAGTWQRRGLDIWQKMPRGYLGDTTHDHTVEFLIVGGVLARDGDALIAGNNFGRLQHVYDDLVARNLLLTEREALRELSDIHVNKTLLKGA